MADQNPEDDFNYFAEEDRARRNDDDASLMDAPSTITSGAFHYEYLNGRRYQAFRENQYMMPNDTMEINRLDYYHHAFRLLNSGKLFSAPLDIDVLRDPSVSFRVLDLGTGNGNWAIALAEEYPAIQVIGNDLSKIQPPWIPDNCEFDVDDIESEWTYDLNYFDFIHIRCLAGAIRDWPKLLRTCLSHLKPGGYLEFQDYDAFVCTNHCRSGGSSRTCKCGVETDLSGPEKCAGVCKYQLSPEKYPDCSSECKNYRITEGEGLNACSESCKNKDKTTGALKLWWDLVTYHARKAGHTLQYAKRAKCDIERVGFVEAKQEIVPWPIGTWPKDEILGMAGFWAYHGLKDGLHAFANHLLSNREEWSDQRIRLMCEAAEKDLSNNPAELYCNTYFLYGRKPLSGLIQEKEPHKCNCTCTGCSCLCACECACECKCTCACECRCEEGC